MELVGIIIGTLFLLFKSVAGNGAMEYSQYLVLNTVIAGAVVTCAVLLWLKKSFKRR